MLPDNVLLKTFDLFLREKRVEKWITLAHMCRCWRSVIFQSSLRLNLQLLCTRARDTLDTWPPLPLIIHDWGNLGDETGVDNIIAVLNHNDRVCQIDLSYSSPVLEYVTNSEAMQKPFPELTDLLLGMYEDDESGPILPDSFLGGRHHVCDHLTWMAFHFWDYRSYFRLPLTSSILTLLIFPVLGTFHPRRWPPASLR
jgi:hypothetical protein